MVLQAAFTVVVHAQSSVTICNDRDFTIRSITPASNGTVGGYRWYENNTLVSTTHTSNTSYTIKAGKAVNTYQYVRQAYATDCKLWQSGNSFTVKVIAGTAPAKPTISGNSANTCPATTVTLTAGSGSSYKWYRNNVAMGVTTATLSVTQSGTYSVANVNTCGETRSDNKVVTITTCCHAPGVTATMQNFNPCPNPATNSTWVLSDSRADAGGQTYTVRLLADGRYWMVDDLKYPTACNKTTFSGARSAGSLGSKVPGFYGDCTNLKSGSTPAARGYLYDWMFVMQHAEAYDGSSWNPGCMNNPGTKAACRGICPEGWHVPTGNPSTGEFTLLNNAVNGGSTTSPSGWLNTNTFNGVYGGNAYSGSLDYQGFSANYWSSAYVNTGHVYALIFDRQSARPSNNYLKYYGNSLRCIRNY